MKDLPLEIVEVVLSYLSCKDVLACRMVFRSWNYITAEKAFASLHLGQSSKKSNIHKSVDKLYAHRYAHLVKALTFSQQDQESILDNLESIYQYMPNIETLEIRKATLEADSIALRKQMLRWTCLKHISIPSEASLLVNTILELPKNRLTSIQINLLNANQEHIKLFFNSIHQARHVSVLKIKANNVTFLDLCNINRGASIACLELYLKSPDVSLLSPYSTTIQPANGVKQLTIDYYRIFKDIALQFEARLGKQLISMYPNIESFAFPIVLGLQLRTHRFLDIAYMARQWRHLREITLGPHYYIESSQLAKSGANLTKLGVYLARDYPCNKFLEDLSSSGQKHLTDLSMRNVIKIDKNTIHLLSSKSFQSLRNLTIYTISATIGVCQDDLHLLLKELGRLETLTLGCQMPFPYSYEENYGYNFISHLRHFDINFDMLCNDVEVIQVYNSLFNSLLSRCIYLRSFKICGYAEPTDCNENQLCLDLKSQLDMIYIDIDLSGGLHESRDYLLIKDSKTQTYTTTSLRSSDRDRHDNNYKPIIIHYKNPFIMDGVRFE